MYSTHILLQTESVYDYSKWWQGNHSQFDTRLDIGAYSYHQHVIGDLEAAASESLIMSLERLVVLTCDDLIGRVDVHTLCLHIVALHSTCTSNRLLLAPNHSAVDVEAPRSQACTRP